MTDADAEAAALADPDAQPLTEEQLAQFERVPNIKAIRENLRLSQKQFAETFGLSLSVVRDWEQGRFFPDRAARTLLKVIAHNPKAVQEALAHRMAGAVWQPSSTYIKELRFTARRGRGRMESRPEVALMLQHMSRRSSMYKRQVHMQASPSRLEGVRRTHSKSQCRDVGRRTRETLDGQFFIDECARQILTKWNR